MLTREQLEVTDSSVMQCISDARKEIAKDSAIHKILKFLKAFQVVLGMPDFDPRLCKGKIVTTILFTISSLEKLSFTMILVTCSC